MANTTASAMGTNKKRATPDKKNIGTNTIQIHSVETKAAGPISSAPTSMADKSGLPKWMCRSMFSMVTMAWSTRIPTDKASPPKVMRLRVSPSANKARMEAKIDSGMVSAMIRVLRQFPKNSSTIMAVSTAAIRASVTTPSMAASTNTDWSNKGVTLMSCGSDCTALGKSVLTLDTMSNVEAPPFFSTEINTPRRPSCRTTLVWGWKPSRT